MWDQMSSPPLASATFALPTSQSAYRGLQKAINLIFNRFAEDLTFDAVLREAGMSREAIQTELKMKAYPVRKLTEQAALLGPEGIARRLNVLAVTDARMKGMGSLPAEMELQLCIGRLLAE